MFDHNVYLEEYKAIREVRVQIVNIGLYTKGVHPVAKGWGREKGVRKAGREGGEGGRWREG